MTDVASASPAERAGMRVGDVVERLNGEPVAGSSGRKFFAAMGKVKPGDRLDLVVLRGEEPVPLTLVAE
ncbi:PDZ domain-containing protein [Pseudoxanthomonas suwonensis]|uniref:PDZ domain-containing protein n=1 Tax=Pseudoxanthomonas suwonensis TaxID=314722 RepID=UPI00130EA08A|nr:PDZ domain-containing protein [Pseudoxanthomonas suwonensis]